MTVLIDEARRAEHGVGLRFRGTVGHGDARGRLLGFPTANLDLDATDGFPADVYDRRMTVDVLAHLRDTVRFTTEAALVEQIRADVDATRRWRAG